MITRQNLTLTPPILWWSLKRVRDLRQNLVQWSPLLLLFSFIIESDNGSNDKNDHWMRLIEMFQTFYGQRIGSRCGESPYEHQHREHASYGIHFGIFLTRYKKLCLSLPTEAYSTILYSRAAECSHLEPRHSSYLLSSSRGIQLKQPSVIRLERVIPLGAIYWAPSSLQRPSFYKIAPVDSDNHAGNTANAANSVNRWIAVSSSIKVSSRPGEPIYLLKMAVLAHNHSWLTSRLTLLRRRIGHVTRVGSFRLSHCRSPRCLYIDIYDC